MSEVNNTLAMSESMKKTLDTFFSGKTINDIDRSTFLLCNLNDNNIKITISIVFLKGDNIEPDSYNSVIIENKGAVFTFPCYWISVPKELTMKYFEYIINSFYDTEVSKWSIAQAYINGNSGTGTNTGNASCGCNQPQTNPCQYITQNI